ncbi:hypothetical protein [Streptomyces sp. NPDC088766]|uniref:hypothetical protein n=1 Tax=Streptomyces sp. NPDC088766 TaxID=3365893 RepID=UPI00382BC314
MSGAGSVLAVENSQTAPLPVSGYQNQPSASPTVTRSVSFQAPPMGVYTWRRTDAAYPSSAERRAVRVIL